MSFKKSFTTFLSNAKGFKFLPLIVYILIGAIMFSSMFSSVKPEKLNLELFKISEQTIRSPYTIEDRASTEKKQKEAEDQVEDVYTLNTDYAANRVDLVTSIFESVSEVNEESSEDYTKKLQIWEETSEEERGEEPKRVSLEKKLELLNTKLPTDIIGALSTSVFTVLLEASPEQLSRAKDSTVTAVNNIMNTRIPANEIENAKNNVDKELMYANVDVEVKKGITELAKYAVIQNVFFDTEATEEKKRQARDAVEPVRILQGQIIVEEGDLITKEIYRQLDLLGFLNSGNAFQPFIGLVLLILLLITAFVFYFHDEVPQKRNRNSYILIFGIIFSVSLVLMKTISLFQQIDYSEIGYIVPVAMGPLLVRLLINERVAIVSSITFAICGSIIFNEGITGTFNFSVGMYYLVSSLAGVLFLSKYNRRGKILQAGLFISFVNIIVIASILLLKNGNYTELEIGFYLIMAVVAGIIAAVLTIGLLPFFEAGFGILSTMRLIELSNPNHPLLRKILTETPGTYHHSVMVANLADSACEAIGANGLLARVASYYHDIGKTKRPQFFIENQMNIENPHDKIAPQLSKNIIISHATDGAEYLRKHKMPKEFIDIAEQHHGTTLLKYFYFKAKENSEKEISESEYRYPGPKAQTKESAIIGIADSVEAAVRSLPNPTPEKIKSLVSSIISDRLQDGQFNECDITLKELDIVAKSLCETLHGFFHSRIEYPDSNGQKVKEA
ncbi:HD family phosphohydrolase [Bacillus sp. PS06]|uniref:HD family phosphohydrolase n=1 Tax=Bacillus sp. PS06 TaxID=2764176 RepID=UPI00177CCD13|nr:HD family phosphohydrolase [Bacillus sp. PS06]MBD8069191.1 HD family phosphohydrolase [Bacillus sp. PS06]